MRAAEDLLGVTRKLKQLWILSETKQEALEDKSGIETRLQVTDVAQELRRILRKDGPSEEEEMDDVQLANAEDSGDIIEME